MSQNWFWEHCNYHVLPSELNAAWSYEIFTIPNFDKIETSVVDAERPRPHPGWTVELTASSASVSASASLFLSQIQMSFENLASSYDKIRSSSVKRIQQKILYLPLIKVHICIKLKYTTHWIIFPLLVRAVYVYFLWSPFLSLHRFPSDLVTDVTSCIRVRRNSILCV